MLPALFREHAFRHVLRRPITTRLRGYYRGARQESNRGRPRLFAMRRRRAAAAAALKRKGVWECERDGERGERETYEE